MDELIKILAIYLRTSMEDKGIRESMCVQSNSILNQRKLIMGHISEHPEFRDYRVVEYIDDGYTGTNLDRPRFHDLIHDIQDGKVACVILKDLSRLGRSYLEVGEYLERYFPVTGVRIIGVADHYDSADYPWSTGGLDVALRNFIYDSYSKDLSVKVRSAMRVRMNQGKYVNVPPYGYLPDPLDKHHLIPDPISAPVVKSIFRMVIEGKTTGQVASELNDHKTLTPLQYKKVRIKPACQGRELLWSHTTVLNILQNIKYTGCMVNHTRESRHLRDKNQRRTKPEEWIITEGTHEPLVSKEDFHLANSKLRHPKEAHSRREPDFDRVFYCGHCGRKLRKTYGPTPHFVCATSAYLEDEICKTIRWSKPDLEAALVPIYRIQLMLLGEIRNAIDDTSVSPLPQIRRLGNLERQINACDEKKLQLFEQLHDLHLDVEEYSERKRKLNEEQAELRKEYTEVRKEYLSQRERQEMVQQQRIRIEDYLTMADDTADEAYLRSMYDAIDRVLVHDGKHLEIRWKFEDIFETQKLKDGERDLKQETA